MTYEMSRVQNISADPGQFGTGTPCCKLFKLRRELGFLCPILDLAGKTWTAYPCDTSSPIIRAGDGLQRGQAVP